ncbi:hypothetical protein AXF42_Ash020127 [Apostasia shenzhenica]|uniref:C2 NT-type domain-containing protein n=1 Tax=Apostasia shenzhenica TaxID=1088818 RepID=A0A2I0A3Q3_9ASPA|nr:hypothetical protein AXF42_Ash020127 [Apostasia shenzhenica]
MHRTCKSGAIRLVSRPAFIQYLWHLVSIIKTLISTFVPPLQPQNLHLPLNSSCIYFRPMADTHNNKLLQELDALSQSLYQAHTSRRTTSLVLPRSANTGHGYSIPTGATASDQRPRSRRLSMSPFRSRPKSDSVDEPPVVAKPQLSSTTSDGSERKGLWSWKPLRALSHIGMHRISILLSVEVIAVQDLPASMNGLRLAIGVRKKEAKDGTVQTMPARVIQGAADFEETLFIRSHVYCSGGGSSGKPLKFEPRPFLVSAIAVDAPELDFGRNTVDLSFLVKESMERSLEGSRIRQWDTAFKLSGKAKGGELVLKLGFQIMEDGGIGIYNQAAQASSPSSSSSFARRQSKSSFSISSPKVKENNPAADLKGIEEFNLDDEPPPAPSNSQEPEGKAEDLDLPEFEVVDKGIEEEAVEVASDQAVGDEASTSSDVVKEVVHDSAHLVRLTELDSIAKQIKALESIMVGDGQNGEEEETHKLNAEEETVTREFLHMLELEGNGEVKKFPVKSPAKEGKNYLSDLGKGLGSVVQTRDGGYLAAINPLEAEVAKKETPKLAMQISRALIIHESIGGFELFQKLAAKGLEELGSKLLSLAAMDELAGKTAEQIAFEGIASAIVSGRNKEIATSAAAKSLAAVKSMLTAMNEGRKERIETGIWNVREEKLTSMEEILCFSLQKIESMAVEGLKLQAEIAEEKAPFEVSPLADSESYGRWPLSSAEPIESYEKKGHGGVEMCTLLVWFSFEIR